MNNYTLLSQTIEEEYQKYREDRGRNTDALLEALQEYLAPIIRRTISFNGYTDEQAVQDLVSDVLLVIYHDKLPNFEEQNAKFATFCGVIAKNKAIDYIKKKARRQIIQSDEIELIMDSNQSEDGQFVPEREMEQTERQLMMIDGMKEYLEILMNLKQKPYRLVGFGYTMILFHLYNPNRKELSSPKWAFEELKEDTVSEGATSFVTDINEKISYVNIRWCDDFYDSLDEIKDGEYVGDLIFGQNFKPKDFENWTVSISGSIREKLQRKMCDLEF